MCRPSTPLPAAGDDDETSSAGMPAATARSAFARTPTFAALKVMIVGQSPVPLQDV
jgi:hypothetical protein